MRIVLDTNVLISGLLSSKGPPGALLRFWLEGRFLLVISKFQWAELARVFNYEKIRSRISPDQGRAFLDHVDALSILVDPVTPVQLSRDPDDNAILASALEGKADFIVSGDKADLLHLKKVEGIPIISARTAVNRLGKKRG